MSSKPRLPVIAMLGVLLLHASGAQARRDVPDPPDAAVDQPAPEPAVQPIPLVSDAPQMSVPDAGPIIKPLPIVPASPVPPPSLTAPRMAHRPRIGLIVAGASIFATAYLLQGVAAFGVAMSGIDDNGPPRPTGTAALLTLIPIVGPWLGPNEIDEPLPVAWVVAWGAIEAGALAILIAGIVGHDVPKERRPRKVSLAPFATPDASGLSLHLRW